MQSSYLIKQLPLPPKSIRLHMINNHNGINNDYCVANSMHRNILPVYFHEVLYSPLFP